MNLKAPPAAIWVRLKHTIRNRAPAVIWARSRKTTPKTPKVSSLHAAKRKATPRINSAPQIKPGRSKARLKTAEKVEKIEKLEPAEKPVESIETKEPEAAIETPPVEELEPEVEPEPDLDDLIIDNDLFLRL
jgi:hypothetical protein